jgi:hypothetical protein
MTYKIPPFLHIFPGGRVYVLRPLPNIRAGVHHTGPHSRVDGLRDFIEILIRPMSLAARAVFQVKRPSTSLHPAALRSPSPK